MILCVCVSKVQKLGRQLFLKVEEGKSKFKINFVDEQQFAEFSFDSDLISSANLR